jgi:hypothetical protein
MLKEVNGKFVPIVVLQGEGRTTYLATLPQVVEVGMRQMINSLLISTIEEKTLNPENIQLAFDNYNGLKWVHEFLRARLNIL